MNSLRLILNLLIVCILIPNGLPQEEGGAELTEEYIDEEFPPESEDLLPPSKPNKSVEAAEVNPKKAHFAEDRFTKLFQGHRIRPRPSPFASPRFASKPKPTLPSFIKNTPPFIRVQPTQPPNNQRSFTQRTTAAPLKVSTTRTSLRGSNSNSNSNRRNQPNINSNRSLTQSSTQSPLSTTDSSSRRRFGGINASGRRNINATIPATRPKRV